MNLIATAPVTLSTGAIVHMPLGTVHDVHATQAGTVVLAAAPAQAPDLSGGSVAGLGGAALIGVILAAVTAAKWKSYDKTHRHGVIKGAAIAILMGSVGLFGVISQTVKTTGDSTGSVISNNITGTTNR